MNETEKNLGADQVKPAEGSAPVWLKRLVMIAGWIGIAVGTLPALNLLCILPLLLANAGSAETVIYGVVSLTLALLTAGAGMVALLHANRSLQNKPSKPLRFPPVALLAGIFLFLIGLGLALDPEDRGAALLLSPFLVVCAVTPPLWAVAWMIPRGRAPQPPKPVEEEPVAEEARVDAPAPVLTWRRGLLSFTGGATVSVFLALVLEILLPLIVLSLVNDLAEPVVDNLRALFRDLYSRDVADALTDHHFIYVFVQIALIAPLAEELAKPLVTLPLLRRLDKQEAFWVGAMAGAGFAALENVIYATAGLTIWAGILVVRALGAALHPLGSGLVAQGWRDVIRGEKDAGKNWLKRFGIAVAVHAAWNGGSLLVITLGGARFFGELPPEIDLLGFSAAGITLAFLIILGITALWIGRLYGHDRSFVSLEEKTASETEITFSDQALAIWALACLIAIVPIGIAGLKLWLR